MRKFSFEVLNEQEFRAFAEASPQSNFQQTVEMANLRRMHGMDVDFVGMRDVLQRDQRPAVRLR